MPRDVMDDSPTKRKAIDVDKYVGDGMWLVILQCRCKFGELFRAGGR